MKKKVEENYNLAVKGIQKEWLEKGNDEWFNYINSLPKDVKIVYTILIFDWQIFNGGFHQYFTNGYGQFALMTITFLKEIKAFKKAILLENAYKIVNNTQEEDDIFRSKLLKFEITSLFKSNELDKPLSDLNNLYDKVEDEDLQDLLDRYY